MNSPRTAVLGISADFHDAAAALVIDGEPVAAAEEERFSRRKHDPSLPAEAMRFCLDEGGVGPGDLTAVVFHEKPISTYERILATHARVGPGGWRQLVPAVSTWSRRKLWIARRVDRRLRQLGHTSPPRLQYCEHHHSHAAAAFFASPFDEAAVLTIDGVGEWATSSLAHGRDSGIRPLCEQRFPDSVGLLYSAFTTFCGFDANDGESKLMGLAPYGTPRHLNRIFDTLVHLADDGSIRLDQRWFGFRRGASMFTDDWDELFPGGRRGPGQPVNQLHADVAASAQAALEEIVLRMAVHAARLTGSANLALAGGVALNCAANGRLLRDGPFERIWVQPAAGDAGSALGAALWLCHQELGLGRSARSNGHDAMAGAFLGPSHAPTEIGEWLSENGIPHEQVNDADLLAGVVAEELAAGAIVGWLQGRMEFGPRALGHRSILADPRDPSMVARINEMVKRREGFRPFAPAVLAERAADWFDLDRDLPYMLVTVPVRGASPVSPGDPDQSLADRLADIRSPLPAVTHVDGSARVQTVDAATNPEMARLLRAFDHLTGCPVLLNTSFNRGGEPIVSSPADAWRTFLAGGLDLLVLEHHVIRRQHLHHDQGSWTPRHQSGSGSLV